MTLLPASHMDENVKLSGADAYVDLYQILLKSGARLYLKNNDTVTWQGNTYEGIPIQLGGVSATADEKASRPTLTVFNPNGIFSPYVRDGELDRATLVRFRVLRQHIDSDTGVYQRNSWVIWRPTAVNAKKGLISFELRDQMDGYNFISPARMFIPPDFPMVSLR